MFPSPLGVISFFTIITPVLLKKISKLVSVPSRGYLFFYIGMISQVVKEFCFRPLSGLSLFLQEYRKEVIINEGFVSVPSRGYLFFYEIVKGFFKFFIRRFRPLSGLSLFLR